MRTDEMSMFGPHTMFGPHSGPYFPIARMVVSMTRPLRIQIENGIYDVTARGWERRVIVRDDRDRKEWLKLLDRVARRSGWRLFAWVARLAETCGTPGRSIAVTWKRA